jgi:hypothetical protein
VLLLESLPDKRNVPVALGGNKALMRLFNWLALRIGTNALLFNKNWLLTKNLLICLQAWLAQNFRGLLRLKRNQGEVNGRT